MRRKHETDKKHKDSVQNVVPRQHLSIGCGDNTCEACGRVFPLQSMLEKHREYKSSITRDCPLHPKHRCHQGCKYLDGSNTDPRVTEQSEGEEGVEEEGVEDKECEGGEDQDTEEERDQVEEEKGEKGGEAEDEGENDGTKQSGNIAEPEQTMSKEVLDAANILFDAFKKACAQEHPQPQGATQQEQASTQSQPIGVLTRATTRRLQQPAEKEAEEQVEERSQLGPRKRQRSK